MSSFFSKIFHKIFGAFLSMPFLAFGYAAYDVGAQTRVAAGTGAEGEETNQPRSDWLP